MSLYSIIAITCSLSLAFGGLVDRLSNNTNPYNQTKRRLVESDDRGLVSTGKVYGVPIGILTEAPTTFDNAYIHRIAIRYNEHIISVQLRTRTLEMLADGNKFIGGPEVGGISDFNDIGDYYEVQDNTCINMVRVYSEGQFIDGLQFCSRLDGFEEGDGRNLQACSQVYGKAVGTLYTDHIPRNAHNGITTCLRKIDIHHGEGSGFDGFINAMKFWYHPNVDALNHCEGPCNRCWCQ